MDDFAKLAERPGAIKLAGSAEFVESPAALPVLREGLRLQARRGTRSWCCPAATPRSTMRAAAQSVSGVNAAMVYGTDGAIAALDLVVMDDNKGAQIVYEPAPVVRAEVLQKYPAIAPALARVFSTLSMRKLQALNAQIAVEGQPARAVAKRYLEQEGLLR